MTGRPSPGSRSPWPLPAGLPRYGLAPLSVGVALLLMFGWSLIGPEDTRPALLVAVALSVLYGGVGPGHLALALTTLVGRDPVLLLVGGLLTAVCAGFRRPSARRQFVRGADEREETVPRSDDPFLRGNHHRSHLAL